MQILKIIISSLFIVFTIPTILLFPAIIVTIIIGAVNKNYHYLKLYLKIWGFSLIGLAFSGILWALVSVILDK